MLLNPATILDKEVIELSTPGTSVSRMLMPQSSLECQHHVTIKREVVDECGEEALPEDFIVYNCTRNEDIFGPENVDIGGVGLALEHGSILIENSRY